MLMPEWNFLMLFILSHLIGDFVLQTGKLAGLKASRAYGVLLHSAIVTAAQVILMSAFGAAGLAAGLAAGVLHFSIDYMKLHISKYFQRIEVLYFLIDQALHIGTLAGLTMLFSWFLPGYASSQSYSWLFALPNLHSFIFGAIIAVIALFTAEVFVQILVRDLFTGLKKRKFFARYERFTDAITMLLLTGFALIVVYQLKADSYNALIFAIPIILLKIPYTSLQRKLTGENSSVLTIKYSAFALLAFILGYVGLL